MAKVGPKASIGSFTDAAQFGEIVVLATLWKGTENAIRLAGPEHLAGKVVLDTTNPLDFDKGVPPTLALGHTDSAGEQVQRWLSDARVVKAFNIVGNAHMPLAMVWIVYAFRHNTWNHAFKLLHT